MHTVIRVSVVCFHLHSWVCYLIQYNTTHYIWRRDQQLFMVNSILEPLDINANVREIEDYFERFEIWCMTRPKSENDKKSVYFLNSIGKSAYTLIKSLAYPDLPISLPYETLKALLMQHMKPVHFEPTECAKYHSMVRQSDQAAKCDSGDLLEMRLKYRLIAGIHDSVLQNDLLEMPKPSFKDVRAHCEQYEDPRAATTDLSPAEYPVMLKTHKRKKANALMQTNVDDTLTMPLGEKGTVEFHTSYHSMENTPVTLDIQTASEKTVRPISNSAEAFLFDVGNLTSLSTDSSATPVNTSTSARIIDSNGKFGFYYQESGFKVIKLQNSSDTISNKSPNSSYQANSALPTSSSKRSLENEHFKTARANAFLAPSITAIEKAIQLLATVDDVSGSLEPPWRSERLLNKPYRDNKKPRINRKLRWLW